MSELLKVIRGQRSLPFTYWICYVGGTVLAFVAFYAWLASAGHFVTIPTIYGFGFYIIIGWILFLTFFIGAGVARSALNRRPRGVWAWLAIAVVALGMIQVPMALLGWPIADAGTEQELRTHFGLINVSLPKRIDNVTTLQRISYQDKIVHYNYVVDDSLTSTIDLQPIKVLAITSVCNSWKRYFDSEELLSVEYQYLHQGSVHAFSVKPSDCI